MKDEGRIRGDIGRGIVVQVDICLKLMRPRNAHRRGDRRYVGRRGQVHASQAADRVAVKGIIKLDAVDGYREEMAALLHKAEHVNPGMLRSYNRALDYLDNIDRAMQEEL